MTKLQRVGLLFYILGVQILAVFMLNPDFPDLFVLIGIGCFIGGAFAVGDD